jgi:hypothetical protein
MPVAAVGALVGGGLAAGAGAAIAGSAALGIAAGAAAGAMVGSSVDQARAAQQGARAQQAAAQQQQVAFQADQRRAEVQNIRNVRSQIRAARLAAGSMTNIAAQTGGIGSSALAGGTASVGSQLSGNLSYMQDVARENTAIANAQIATAGFQAQAARAAGRAAVYGAVGDVAGTIFSTTGGSRIFQS